MGIRDHVDLGPVSGTAAAFAVRSSAVGEDGADLSFAGLHASLLDVEGEEALIEAIHECLESQDPERTSAYREETGASIVGRGVVVQRMVPADCAGICFTRSPSSPEEMVVELVSGLAAGLAAGLRRPARVHLAREGLAVRSVDDPERLLEKLGIAPVRRAAELSFLAERRFGQPLDVEWAASDRCYLVQARAITGTTRLARIGEIRREEIERLSRVAGGRVRVWTDFSVADMLPRPSPLAFEVMRWTARRGGGIQRSLRHIGLRPTRSTAEHPTYELICGRLYVNLDVATLDEDLPLAVDARYLPTTGALPLDPEHLRLRPAWPGWGALLRLPATLARLALAPLRLRAVRRTLAREFEELIRPRALREAARLRERDLRSLSDRELWEAFRDHLDRIDELMYYHQLTDNVSFFLHALLRAGLRLLYGEGSTAMEARLTTALSGNLNTETNLDLARVACGELDRAAFLDRYGHRGNPDWEISAPRWREDPSRVEAMVAAIARAPRSPVQRFRDQQRVRAEAEASLSALIRRRWWIRPFHSPMMRTLQDYQRYSPQRETTQGLCYLFIELARSVALEGARRTGLGELVFFLTLAELERWLLDREPSLVETARARRRRLRAAWSLYLPHVVRSDALEVIGVPPSWDPHLRRLTGQGVSSGTVRGRARVVHGLEEARGLDPGEILVAQAADPAWTPLFLVAAAVVLEQGGLLSHPAIVAREYGLPALVNVAHATRIIRSGQLLTVDADRGLVLLEEAGRSVEDDATPQR